MNAHLLLCLVACALQCALADVDIITEPRPGEEYVLVSSGQQTPVRSFETSHKIPEKHPQHRALRDEATENTQKITKKLLSGKNVPKHEGIVSIEEEKRVLLKKGHKSKITESIEIDVPVSKLEDIRIKENKAESDVNAKMAVDLETMSESGRLSGASGTTTQKPVLTTGAPAHTPGYDFVPVNFDSIDDINSGLLSSNVKLETAGSEQKQRSRIQIKKGPNGQDYEYEYIYYYYDDDEKATTTAAPVHNAHDGPQKEELENQIAKDGRSKSKYSTIERSSTTSSPATTGAAENQNEVLPASGRGRQRGRNIVPAPVQEEVLEDSTRFPPRGRQLSSSTTYVPEVSADAAKGRARGEAPADDAAGKSRNRARAHIRRPSSELVDLDSFKTHSGDIPVQYKELPSRYSAESKSTTEYYEASTESREPAREGHSIASGIKFQEISDDSKLPADYKTTTTYEQDTTEYTTMTAMEKVALDLYAYLAGEKLNNEISPATSDMMSFDGTTTTEEEQWTTEPASTTEEPTTTTTTTTTTPAPTTTTTTTTTTTPAPSTRASRFKLRNSARARPGASTTSAATEPPPETSTKAKGRFTKSRIGQRRGAGSSSPRPASSATQESSTTATVTKQPLGGRRSFLGRARPKPASPATPAAAAAASTPAAAAPASAPADAVTDATASVPKKELRVLLRRLPQSMLVPGANAAAVASLDAASVDASSSTSAPRTIGRGNLRPLRPGTRLNPSRAVTSRRTTVAAAASVPDSPAQDAAAPAESSSTEPVSEESVISSTPITDGRLKPRVRPGSTPKRVTFAPLPRRANPLLRRRQTSATELMFEAEAVTEPSVPATETDVASAEPSTTAATPAPTQAPPLRGLDALRARRRTASAAAAAKKSRR